MRKITQGQVQMKQVFLAVALIAAAIGVFIGARVMLPGQAPIAVLGDLSTMQTIVMDVQTIAKTGDLAAAKTRIADLETAWDDAEATMQPMNPEAWGRVDSGIDAALTALRAGTPDAGKVDASLVALMAMIADPGAADAPAGRLVMIGDIAVTDAAGHALPCETMLAALRDALVATPPQGDAATAITALQAKATERCNADDDKNADAFSAAALQQIATQ